MFKWYKGGRVFQIEIDAMYARRDQFKALLHELIDSKFDNKIYEEHVVKKLEIERDALTMRLKDKFINERIALPGAHKIEERMNAFKSILLGMGEGSFLMNLIFAALFSAITKRNEEGESG
jgi:hypothetical protein